MPPPRRGKGKGKGKFAKDKKDKGQRALFRRRQVLPLHGREGGVDRLQGRRGAEGLRQRDRQDHSGAHHRHRGRYQRQLSEAIKRARFLALLPYTDLH